MRNWKDLIEICETPGAPGFEYPIRNLVKEKISSYVDEVNVDALGNLVCLKRGIGTNAKKVILSSHLDEIGFMVSHVDSDGFIHFQPLGGFDPKTLTAQRVIIHGKEDVIGVMGTKPIHLMSPDEKSKAPKIQDFFIDTGLLPEKVDELISVGDPITRERQIIQLGDCINGKSLDNRVSVFILLEVMRTLKQQDWDIYAVFSVQEEVGMRGAMTSAHQLNADFAIAIDTTIANDLPGASDKEKITTLGKGPAIKLFDASVIPDYRMVSFLKDVANANEIPWQAEILPAGGTDTAAFQRFGKGGSIAGAVSIPTRYLHQVTETAHKGDVEHGIRLLVLSVEEISKKDWSHK